jgi:hypothetical protein
MAPLCSSNEGSTHRKCPGVDTRSVRRASGLLETRFSSLDSRMVGNSETIVRSTNTKSPMRSLSVVGVCVFEFLADHPHSGSYISATAELAVDPPGTLKNATIRRFIAGRNMISVHSDA